MNPIARTITTLSLVVMLFAGWAQAQNRTSILKVKVPFEFAVGNKTFPAGSYSVVRTAPNILELRDARQQVVAVVMTALVQTGTPHSTPKLDFQTVNGQHILRQVWFAFNAVGNELTPSKKELSQAKTKTPPGSEQARLP